MNSLFTIMDALLTCVRDRIEGVCVITMLPDLTLDQCECRGQGLCGQAWVRLVEASPVPAGDRAAGRFASVITATIEVGAVRCVPGLDRMGRPPSEVANANSVLAQTGDLMALLQAILCCAEVETRRPQVGRWTPISGGGCGGGTWRVSVQVTP